MEDIATGVLWILILQFVVLLQISGGFGPPCSCVLNTYVFHICAVPWKKFGGFSRYLVGFMVFHVFKTAAFQILILVSRIFY